MSLSDVWHAVRRPLERGDPRPALNDLLRRDYCADQVVLAASGTQALLLALRWAKREGSGCVALPAFTCYDVATAAVGSGMRVRFYDLDPNTLGPDFESLRESVARGAEVVIVSPLFGVPVDWQRVEECVVPGEALVIEDAAQGHGAAWDGRPLGSLGDVSVLSFGRGKGWTGVHGGALLFRRRLVGPEVVGRTDPGVVEESKVLLAAFAQWALGRPGWYQVPASIPWLRLGETHYRAPSAPERITGAAAALALHNCEASSREADARRVRARALLEGIRPRRDVRTVTIHPRARAGYLRLPLLLSRGMAGFASPDHAARLGIAPSYPKSLTELAPLRPQLEEPAAPCPGAAQLVRELVTCPTHSRTSATERQEVLRLIHAYPA